MHGSTANAWVHGYLLIASRSDGYTFAYFERVGLPPALTAGCRGPWTIEESRDYWERTRGGTALGNETTAILDFFESSAKARGFSMTG